MTILNYTPHPVTLLSNKDEVIFTFESKGLIRLKATTVEVASENGIRFTKTVFGEPEGLPEFKIGIYYIVSQLVKSALPNRVDLLVPAEVVRDSEGTIIGCRSLGM